ncbi:MAG: GldG family protein [Candidatus Sumerlaeaceae bacterium]|jgi:gliding-associated putative ABC transporter substrate-binding component GldG
MTTNVSNRTLKYGTNVVIGTILFFAVLVAINFFAGKSRMRVDLTRGKQFTISEATRKILASLKDRVNITVYATMQETPPDWTEQRNQLFDLLQEYRIASRGKVHFTFKDPSADPKIEEEAQRKGIREQTMQKVGTTELSLKAGYLGFVVDYKGKTETVAALRPEQSVEYQLTRAINKAAQVNVPTVGIMAPAGNPFFGEQGKYDLVPRYLEEEGYKTQNVEVSKPNLKDVDVLMIFEPEDLSEEALYKIDQYVMNGGKLFVAAGGVNINPQMGRATAKVPNINSILEFYGMHINGDLLEDWGKALPRLYRTQRGLVRAPDPFFVAVTDLNTTSIITKDLSALITIYPSSVGPSARGTSASLEVLARTSPLTRRQESFFTIEPEKLRKPAKQECDSYNICMMAQGKLESRFATVEPPVLTNDDGTTRAVLASEVKRESDPKATVIVYSCPLSFHNEVISPTSDGVINALFLLNVADALTRGGEMISLRSKQAQNAVLKADITPTEAITAQVLAIGGVPVLLIILGLGRFYFNRLKRLRYREIYGS